MTIIFAKTRWPYDSYQDLWKLVELSGFPVCFVDEMDIFNQEHTYVTAPFNGELLDFMNDYRRNNKRAEIVLWNLERPGGSGTIEEYIRSNTEHIHNGHISRVIVSDKQLARDTGFQYVTLGSHPDLGSPIFIQDKAYDVIHLMCYSNRRGPWFSYPGNEWHALQYENDVIKIAPNCWGEERHKALQQSRFMLSIHQDDFMYIEPLRLTLAAAYGLPIISEECADYFPYTDCAKTSNADALKNVARLVKEYLRDDHWYFQGLRLRTLMTEEFTFRRCLEEML